MRAADLRGTPPETMSREEISTMIHRRNEAGETLTTHCLYFLGVEQERGVWRIGSVRQKVLMSYGEPGIHKGIAKR